MKIETNEIYDKLCHILTDYETGNADENDLYKMLIEIQNEWEPTITAD